MNYYIVVEGKSGESKVYPKWIHELNPELTQVYSPAEILHNNFLLVSGNGYPQYFRIVDGAVEDCNAYPSIDFLVIAVDAEDMSREEKIEEIQNHLGTRIEPHRVKIIVQHPCLETWALGNRIVCRRNPQDKELRSYLRFYDVRERDPEELPSLEEKNLNRCQFAFVYLKRMLFDRYPKLTYTKSNPVVIEHERYFAQIKRRLNETDHICSFEVFVDTFGVI